MRAIIRALEVTMNVDAAAGNTLTSSLVVNKKTHTVGGSFWSKTNELRAEQNLPLLPMIRVPAPQKPLINGKVQMVDVPADAAIAWLAAEQDRVFAAAAAAV